MLRGKACLFIINRREKKETLFLLKILIRSYMVMHYIMEKNIFAVIVC